MKNAIADKELIAEQLKKQMSPEDQAIVKKMSAAQKDELFAGNADYSAALSNEKAVTKEWGMGGDSNRALNAVTIAITGALGGQTDLQVASNALAPYAAQVIGQQFGHGEDKNTAAQMVSHAILGATLAYVNGGNPAAGGSAAVASEAAATYFTNQYKDDPRYQNEKGEFIPNLLPEDVKTQIRDLTTAIGAVVGGTVGDSAFNAQLAGVVGQNAVENNIDSPADYKNAQANARQLYKSACASAGLSAGSAACGQVLRNQTAVILKQAGNLTLDFIPIIGDIKGFHEAQDFGDYFFASVGLIPIVGDAAKSYHKAQKAYDIAEKARDVAGMKAAINDAVQACTGGACFTAGTLIETDRGLKAVEQFEGGELIWSRNDVTLEYGYRPVIATKVTAEQAIFEVVIQNKTGQQEILETTAEHPFWIKDFGWLKASLLQSGMTLLDRNNEELTIVSQALIPNKVETVYNIEVDGFHTYHVGELGTWVHNANCCEIKQNIQKIEKNYGYAGVHSLNRHGAGTTLEQQKYRAKTGIPPDQPNKLANIKDPKNLPDATRFLSNEDLEYALQQAIKSPDKEKGIVEIDFGRKIGEGYYGGGKVYAESSKAVVIFDKKTGKLVSAYPVLPAKSHK